MKGMSISSLARSARRTRWGVRSAASSSALSSSISTSLWLQSSSKNCAGNNLSASTLALSAACTWQGACSHWLHTQTCAQFVAWVTVGRVASPPPGRLPRLAPCLRLIWRSPGRWPLLVVQPRTSHAPSAWIYEVSECAGIAPLP